MARMLRLDHAQCVQSDVGGNQPPQAGQRRQQAYGHGRDLATAYNHQTHHCATSLGSVVISKRMVGLPIRADESPIITRQEQVEGISATSHSILALLQYRTTVIGNCNHHSRDEPAAIVIRHHVTGDQVSRRCNRNITNRHRRIFARRRALPTKHHYTSKGLV
nr:MAG TPA: hypothetical protein [Caudoviricetes sp.]